jgi:SET family sugar efflux transporter-like MFS transporter
VKRLLIPSAALLWGLQFAFLNPAIALLLVALFGATAAQVGWVLAVYNVSGFVASLLLPGWADRRQDYLRPMLGCGLLTLGLAVLLASTSSLPVAVVALVVFGGPAGVGISLLFAHLKHSGASRSDVVNTRAIVSFAWVAGPPLASFLIAGFGNRAVLVAIGVVAVLNLATAGAMLAQRGGTAAETEERPVPYERVARARVATIVVAVVALQATNSAAVSVMALYVTRTLGLNVAWAGAALGVSAALEIPALLLIGRLGLRYSDLGLVATGCAAGIAYYTGMAVASGPVLLIGLQALNAVFIAIVAGVGLALFQRIIPRPGLATGLYTNTRRVGAIISGPIIALGSVGTLGYRTAFIACAVLTAAALPLVLAGRASNL